MFSDLGYDGWMEKYVEEKRRKEEERIKKKEERQKKRKEENERRRKERLERTKRREEWDRLRIERREVREKHRAEDMEWEENKRQRREDNGKWHDLSRERRKRREELWRAVKRERRKAKKRRIKEDEAWREKRRELREAQSKDKRMSKELAARQLLCILLVVDNCTRYCISLRVVGFGRSVTSNAVVKVLSDALRDNVRYIISDNGKQFIARGFQKFCRGSDIVHVKISPHRAQTNGIAERLVRTVKDMLRLREWNGKKELEEILVEVQLEYNERPNQGIGSLSPVECRNRLYAEEWKEIIECCAPSA